MESAKTRRNWIVGAIGSKGTGKTALARLLFRKHPRVIAVDPMSEYDGGFIVSGHLDTLDYLCGTKQFRVIYRPLDEADIAFACRTALAARKCLLIIEELGRYCEPQSIPAELDEVVTRGRHRCVDFLYTVQRFQMIHKNVSAMTDEFYIFRQFEAVDLEQIDRRFGRIVADQVRSLDDLEALKINVKEFRPDDRESFSLVSIVPGVGVFNHRRAAKVAGASDTVRASAVSN